MTEAKNVVEKRLELNAPPERVWQAITDPREIACWFGERAALDLRPDGEGYFEWEQHGRFAARVEIVEPPRRLVWHWVQERDTPIDKGHSTRVEWLLTPSEGGGTILELRETGFATPAARDDNDGGWDHELGELADHLSGNGSASI